MNIGLCGTGKMGSAMAERLMDEDESLSLWNRTAARAAALVDRGATLAPSPAALAAACDVVIVMLLDDDALAAAYESADGLLSAELGGRTILDMSTVRPDTARRLAARVREAGGAYVECPVGGTVTPARTGKLLGLAGGNADDFERVRPILEKLCRRVELCGEVGAGAAMKLAINLPLLAYWEALGEALSFAEGAGVERALAGDILVDSSGAVAVAKPRVPGILEVIGGKEPGPPNFQISGAAKDLRLMTEVAPEFGFDAPIARATRECYDAAVADGWGERDFPLLAAWRFSKRG